MKTQLSHNSRYFFSCLRLKVASNARPSTVWHFLLSKFFYMDYEILETHCVFEKNVLTEVAVLWADDDHVRATYSNLSPKIGHDSLKDNEVISGHLLQRIAGYGTYLDDARKKKYFPGKRRWSR